MYAYVHWLLLLVLEIMHPTSKVPMFIHMGIFQFYNENSKEALRPKF